MTVAGAGAMAGLAASSASTGADVYRMGKLDAVDVVTLDEQVAAVLRAVESLAFTLEAQDAYAPGRWRCKIADDRGSRFRVYLDQRTERVCRTRVDVGVLGSESTARLFLAQIRQVQEEKRTA